MKAIKSSRQYQITETNTDFKQLTCALSKNNSNRRFTLSCNKHHNEINNSLSGITIYNRLKVAIYETDT